MYPQILVVIVFVAFPAILLVKATLIVPKGNAYVVERLGRYQRTLHAGVQLLAPFVEVVRARYSLAEQALAVATEPCRTRDDREVFVGGTLAYRISDPERATYAVADLRVGLTGVTHHATRDAVQGVALDELHASRRGLETAVVRGVQAKTTRWGVDALRFEITDISR